MRDLQEFADKIEFIIGVIFIMLLYIAFGIVFDWGKYSVTGRDRKDKNRHRGNGAQDRSAAFIDCEDGEEHRGSDGLDPSDKDASEDVR